MVGNVEKGYTVTWRGSTTLGVTYILEEASDSGFTSNVQTVYSGPAKTTKIIGRPTGGAYFYRVRAIKAGVMDSVWQEAG